MLATHVNRSLKTHANSAFCAAGLHASLDLGAGALSRYIAATMASVWRKRSSAQVTARVASDRIRALHPDGSVGTAGSR
jgi:hypothetical protein